jgi:hypothetical protein
LIQKIPAERLDLGDFKITSFQTRGPDIVMKSETVRKENGLIPGIGCSLWLVLNALVEERGHVEVSGLFYQQLSPHYEQATDSE